MKHALFAAATLCLLGDTHADAQSGTIKIKPDWAVGDERVVHTTASVHLYLGDTVAMTTTTEGSVGIRVNEKKKDRFILEVYLGRDDQPLEFSGIEFSGVDGMGSSGDSITSLMNDLVKAMLGPLLELRERYVVDANGKVIEWKHDEADKARMIQAMMDGLTATLERIKPPGKEIPDLFLRRFEHMADSAFEAMAETMANTMEFFFQGYAPAYPDKGTRRDPVMVTDIDAPLRTDAKEIPAIMEVGFDQLTETTAVARVVTEYDQQALAVAFADEDRPPMKDLRLTEESVYEFDRRSGWLTKSTITVLMRSDQFKMTLVTTTVLKKR